MHDAKQEIYFNRLEIGWSFLEWSSLLKSCLLAISPMGRAVMFMATMITAENELEKESLPHTHMFPVEANTRLLLLCSSVSNSIWGSLSSWNNSLIS